MNEMIVSGPMFAPKEDDCVKSLYNKKGGHYNQYGIRGDKGMMHLRRIFPKGEANEYNFVLFSTSGIHGLHTTIEEIEEGLKEYGDNPVFKNNEWPDDYHGNEITVLIVQPRICTLHHGHIEVTLEDIGYLKKLRESSWKIVQDIGKSSTS